MLNKSDFEKIDKRLESITTQPVEEIEVSVDLPPTIDQLQDNNKAYSIKAAILFIDIRKSTFLTESSQAKSMVKIYRAFMRMAVDCVRKNGGVTRQFLGDRIMGVFIDTYDTEGRLIESSIDKAVNCGRALLTIIDYSLNKHLKNNVSGKMIECGIGIDYGKILVTQVGMYGVENDEKKENEVDTVWVGNTTNFASKFSDSAEGGEIFISQNVYGQLSTSLKEDGIWQSSARSKGNRTFNGYIAKDFYLDFFDELGTANKLEQNSDSHQATANQLAEGLLAVEELLAKLIVREKELAVLEAELKKENQRLSEDNSTKTSALNTEHNKRTLAESALRTKTLELYNFIYSIIEKSHCKNDYIKGIGQEEWQRIINKFYQVGHSLGFSDEDITVKADCQLIGIYNFYQLYDKAFEATLIMAKETSYWISIQYGTIKWACERNCIYKLEYEIRKKLDNFEIPYERRNDYQGYLQQIKGIRGY